MATALLIVIYLSFISLGLPDTLLGAAWPAMQTDFNASLDTAGILSFTVSLGTVISSLLSSKLISKFGTGFISFFSITATAIALLGYSFSNNFMFLVLSSIPLGLGAGAVDVALNNFVATHFRAKHMNWLHCFWGLGAMAAPIIMSLWVGTPGGWRMGYRSVSIIQFFLVGVLILSLPLWRRMEKQHLPSIDEDRPAAKPISNLQALRAPGVKTTLLAFFCYCAIEISTGLWSSSYLVQCKDATTESAAVAASMFYGGITIGRLISGFLSEKVSDRHLIRFGQILSLAALLLLLMPLSLNYAIIGLFLFGFGCAPIYPSMLHVTPERFGTAISQTVMGLEMSVAYLGSTILPSLLGFVAERTGISIFPYFLLLSIGAMLIVCERLNHRHIQRRAAAGRDTASNNSDLLDNLNSI